jgi:hypothetical protein
VREHPYFSCGASLRAKSEGGLFVRRNEPRGAGATNRYVKYDNRRPSCRKQRGSENDRRRKRKCVKKRTAQATGLVRELADVGSSEPCLPGLDQAIAGINVFRAQLP